MKNKAARMKKRLGICVTKNRRRHLWFVFIFLACSGLSSAASLTFTVNSPEDVVDANPGDGVCETAPGNGVCTLRAAIQEANAHPGADVIVLQANTTYTLTIPGDDDVAAKGDLNLTDSVTIVGAGPGSTIIDGNGAVTGDRVFRIPQCVGNELPNMQGFCERGIVTATISGVTIQHGQQTNFGGGILSNGTLTLLNCNVSYNTVNGLNDWGGGIYNSGLLTVVNSTISYNVSGTHNAFGGGIYNQGPMTLTNSTITGNTTGGSGGGILQIGSPATSVGTIRNCTISGNTAVSGGGLYKEGADLVVINSTFSSNFSTGDGGGIYAMYGALKLFNTTVTKNRANSDGSGTGVGGGVTVGSGATFTFQNSIIAQNENELSTGQRFPILNSDDCSGTLTSNGNNIMHDVNSSYCTLVGGVTIADPNLAPLEDNGGPTQTHALTSGSAPIDAGNPGGCTDNLGAILTTDQRGYHRPEGSACDIGAFEFGPSNLGNISTRLAIQTGDNVLIGGFIVTGTQPKKVILRAIGPSLNIAGNLQDPVLELYGPNGLISSNDNWTDSPDKQAIIDSTVAPTNALESAIVATLPANNTGYTAIVRGVNGTTGIGLVEVYDLDPSVDSRLANVSTRGIVQSGDDVMIGGFIVIGTENKKVIARAIGPSLPVAGTLADPMLELHDANGAMIASNDNWRSDQEAEIMASGVPPMNDLESAIVTTLPPAPCTAIVRGVNGATGIGLVEVYALN